MLCLNFIMRGHKTKCFCLKFIMCGHNSVFVSILHVLTQNVFLSQFYYAWRQNSVFVPILLCMDTKQSAFVSILLCEDTKQGVFVSNSLCVYIKVFLSQHVDTKVFFQIYNKLFWIYTVYAFFVSTINNRSKIWTIK